MSNSESVYDLMLSHRITAVIYVAAKLNLAEALAESAKSTAELAKLVSADESALESATEPTGISLTWPASADSFTRMPIHLLKTGFSLKASFSCNRGAA